MDFSKLKLGPIMQACRERAGLSQEQMAEKLYRSRSCISKIENENKTLDVKTMLMWIEATGAKDVAVAFFCGMDGLSIMQNVLQLVGS